MPTRIVEFHGAAPLSTESLKNASKRHCPFVNDACKKSRSGGACSIATPSQEPVIICPNRLYDENFQVIRNIAAECFDIDPELITSIEAERRRRHNSLSGNEVVVFGQGFSGEIGISAPSEDDSDGTFKIDFLLSQVDADLQPTSIIAIEVQTIDTTNSYKAASDAYYKETSYVNEAGNDFTPAGFNWENVSKRILPQIIYKGHALRRERLAQNGLYFVLPDQVLSKIKTRVGGELLNYPKGPGTVTFKSYVLSPLGTQGERSLVPKDVFTTTVEQLAFAFVSPRNLPPLGIYEDTLAQRLAKLTRKRKV